MYNSNWRLSCSTDFYHPKHVVEIPIMMTLSESAIQIQSYRLDFLNFPISIERAISVFYIKLYITLHTELFVLLGIMHMHYYLCSLEPTLPFKEGDTHTQIHTLHGGLSKLCFLTNSRMETWNLPRCLYWYVVAATAAQSDDLSTNINRRLKDSCPGTLEKMAFSEGKW